eukprot:1182408-Prorocentrum_minimum.AAC.1
MRPHGEEFTAVVRSVMRREDHWVEWKRDTCPAFERHAKPDPKDSKKDASNKRDDKKEEEDMTPLQRAMAAKRARMQQVGRREGLRLGI